MTADVELLPLPEPDYLMPQGRGWPYIPAWSENTVHQLIAHATAAKDAEIERLRAEVEAWRELSDHVRAGACNAIWPDRYTDARTRDVAAALKRAERLAEALRECADDLEGEIQARASGELPRRIKRDMATVERARDALRDHDQEVGNG